ncbi:MAG: hypothetical protein WD294_08735 [Phycisphaeraceae bacterium]
MANSSTQSNTTRQALDELAALFLTPAPPSATATPPPAAKPAAPRPEQRSASPNATATAVPQPHSPAVEAVMLGHLPGFASPWITQYAHILTQREQGDVAIAHVDDDEDAQPGVRLEMVQLGDQTDPPPPLKLHAETLEQAIAAIVPEVSTVLVVVTDPERPRIRRWLEHVSCWTLISGADETAIVGAYRLLKALRQSPFAASVDPPRVQLALMGSDDEVAAAAVARLARATAKHLDITPTLAASRKRLEPARRHPIWQVDQLEDALPRLLQALEQATPSPAPINYNGNGTAAPSTSNGHAAPTTDPPTEAPPKPPRAEATQADARKDEETAGMSTYLENNAIALAARCPRCASVELAVDAAGQLHLMRVVNDATPADAALRELIETRAWAVEHAAVLALTLPNRTLNPALQPRLHLFSAEPAPLLERLAHASHPAQQLLALHLLKPVELAGQITHVHAALTHG